MPLLGGIFGRKSKSSAHNDHGVSHGPASISSSDIDSILSTSTTSYVTTEKSLPSSPNGKNFLSPVTTRNGSSQLHHSIAGRHPPSSSRLRLPFSRKKQKAPVTDTSSTSNISPSSIQPPSLPYPTHLSTSAASDTDVTDSWRLHPPPSKSAVFAAYVDSSNALSSRSLPDESMQSWSSPSPPAKSPPKEPGKRPSPFSWTKSPSGIIKPPTPEPSKPPRSMNLDSSLRLDSDSFNLKSFRHVHSSPPSASTSSLVVPSARPRGTSINSDSSQRISVAAFREAQARRSTAGSPVPSFRSPSPSFPQLRFPQDGQRGRTSSRPSPVANQTPSGLAVGYTSESEESATASEEESDDGTDGCGNVRVHRNRTITARKGPLVGRQAKSDIGHGSTSYCPATPSSRPSAGYLATRSQSGHEKAGENIRQISYAGNPRQPPVETPPPPPLRSNSSLDVYGGTVRSRASASTSALSPSAATKRTSILVNAGLNQDPLVEVQQTTRHARHSPTLSGPTPSQFQSKCVDPDASELDSDSDNAPLAALVPPRRPGSALSQVSNTSLQNRGPAARGMAKPLIDINELSNKKPSIGPYRSDDDGFTKGGLLASHLSSSEGSGVSVKAPASVLLPPNPSSGSIGLSGVISAPPNLTSFMSSPSPPKKVQACTLDARPTAVSNRHQPQPVQQYDTRKEKDGNPERRRDGLTERLAKLAKGKGKDSIDASTSLGFGGMMRSTSPPSPQHPVPQTGPASSSKHSAQKLSVPPTEKPSPPDNNLICGVDDSILHLILNIEDSNMSSASVPTATSAQGGEEAGLTSESESDGYGEPERKKEKKGKETDRIAPILIKQREPPSSFSVMSRPPMSRHLKDDLRSTLTAASLNTNASTKANTKSNAGSGKSSVISDSLSTVSNLNPNSNLTSFSPSTTSSSNTARKRSSTLIPSSATSTLAASSPSSSTFFGASSSFTKPNTPSRGELSVVSLSNTNSTETSCSKSSSVNTDGVLKTIASSGNSINMRSVDPAHTLRQRSSTMVTMMPSSTSSQNKNNSRAIVASTVPVKPFAARRDSPASSTGDSSSGRAPLTPKDGSDIGSKTIPSSRRERKDEWSSGVSGLSVASTKGGVRSCEVANGPNKHLQGRSVSFNDDVRVEENGKNEVENENDAEIRRKERRRGEAKAAIELGNVINGPGPIVSDDEDDLPTNQAMDARMTTMHPMMAMGNQMSMQMPFSSRLGSPEWGGNLRPQGGPPQMLVPPQFMVPTAGPNYMAAHQQAMMFAKQAYQIAVAQQAMAAAADEWDRNSVMGGSGYGDPSSNASVMMGASPFNMMGGMSNGWSTGSVIFPNSAQSVYGEMGRLVSSRSEYGGRASVPSMAGKWNSARSMYGDNTGQSTRSRPSGGGGWDRNLAAMRNPGYYPPVLPIPHSGSGSSSPGNGGRGRSSSGPATPSRGGTRKAPGV